MGIEATVETSCLRQLQVTMPNVLGYLITFLLLHYEVVQEVTSGFISGVHNHPAVKMNHSFPLGLMGMLNTRRHLRE
jgi:hypothetical protein